MTVVARWNGREIARSHNTIKVEGNHYFPRADVSADALTSSTTTSVCPWKGTASYHSVVVDGEINRDAAWFYPDPRSAAEEVRNRIAFWKGVEVREE